MKLATFFLKKLSSYFLLLLVLSYNGSFGQIISQYVETNSGTTPKGVEIWNNTGSTLDFSSNNLVIEKGNNGNAGVADVTVSSGTLAAGVVMVIGTSDIGTYLTNQGLTGITFVTEGFTFNGDDALIVKYGGTTTDMFGLEGQDPGSHWTGSSVSTKNSNIRLIDETDSAGSGISSGDTDGWTDPSSRFVDDGYTPADADGLTGFGEAPITTAWDGSTNTVWGTSANWSNGVPASTSNVSIPNVSNDPVISSTGIQLTNLTVKSSGSLTINADSDLTLSGNFSNSGTVTLNSNSSEFASIIVQGTSSGDIVYKRYVNIVGATKWDLIGSPVIGQTFSGFVTANAGDLATDGTSPVEYAIGLYDNSDNTYDNYDSGTVGVASFDIGLGYAMASVNGETLDFTGTIAVLDQEQAITTQEGSGGKKWNLVANPFPSFINANTNAHASNNFITINGTGNLHDTFLAVYGYNDDAAGYVIYNNLSSATYIAPGQGFFVAADADVNLDFTEAMQTVTGTDDFISGDTMDDMFEVLLRLYHGEEKIEETRLYFENGLNLGLDPGYDAGAFDENAALMTRLVEEDEGHGMAINAMSTEDMDDVVIPLEINQTAGQEFRINLHTSSIGEVNIYLEDTELGTLTLLNEEDFVMTPTSDLSDAGRFYVHLTANALSNEEVNTSLLNAYKEVNANYITIEGLATQTASTEVSLFNILGTKVMDTSLDNTTNTQTVSTNGFSTGIYVLKLVSGKNQLTKKLIIK